LGEKAAKREDLRRQAGTAVNSIWLKSPQNLEFLGLRNMAGDCCEQENGGGSVRYIINNINMLQCLFKSTHKSAHNDKQIFTIVSGMVSEISAMLILSMQYSTHSAPPTA
jgi:hypothetical protein